MSVYFTKRLSDVEYVSGTSSLKGIKRVRGRVLILITDLHSS